MEGQKEKKARKRGWSSSSPSAQNYRLKRTLLMGKRRGPTTPVPAWKMIASQSQFQSQSLQNHRDASTSLNGGNARDLTARELAAVMWEIDGLPSSPTLKLEKFGDKRGGEGMPVKQRVMECSKLRSMERGLSHPSLSTVSEGILDPTKLCSCGRKALDGWRKTLRSSSNLNHICVGQNHASGLKNNLEDVCNGLTTSKKVLHLLSHVLEKPECISSMLISVLGVELDRSCNRVSKLIQGGKIEKNVMDAFPSIVGKLETEKNLRRRSEKLTKKTEAELAETRASLTRVIKELESEKKARRKAEQVCEELARGVWDLKRQFGKVREEVEREREMFQIADLLREERVQMKLSDAKCLYEERNALVEKLRNELEASLKGEDKCKEIVKLLKDSKQKQERRSESDAAVDQVEEESDDSGLHSIELSTEEISKSFCNAAKTGSTRNSFDTSKGRIPRKQPFVQNQKLQMALLSRSQQENYGFS